MSDTKNLPNDWDSFANSGTNQNTTNQGQKGSGLFMRLEKREKPYVVRLCSSPEPFRQHWQAFKPLTQKPVTSPVFELADKDKDYAWNVGGFVPTKKYAILVIDREDGQLKIMQGGEQIFGTFKTYIEHQKKLGRDHNPTGPNAPDWVITVGTKDNQTHYTCSADNTGPKPLNEAEATLVANFKFDWRSCFKKSSPEEVKAMWEKLPEDKKYSPKQEKGPRTTDGGSVIPQVTKTAAPSAAPVQTQVVAQASTPPAGAAEAVVNATTTQTTQASARLF